MQKNILYIIIAILLITTVFFWHRARELSLRLSLIQERIEEAKERIEKPVLKAKVGIVLDDFGYNLNNIKDLWEIDAAITLSILPNLPYSTEIARAAEERGLEVMLHLPLEPKEHFRLEEGTIMTDMTEEEILETLEKAISSVPGLAGISSHMGSRATEDERVMAAIFERMKEENLYFLDSLVTNKSVCKSLSGRMSIKFIHRSVFLDNESDVEYIKKNLRDLADQALRTGWALGVGHDRPLTISVIKEMIAVLEGMGIEVVPVSEIVR